MKFLIKILKFKTYLVLSFFLCLNLKADNHNIYETLEIIKKTLKRLRRQFILVLYKPAIP